MNALAPLLPPPPEEAEDVIVVLVTSIRFLGSVAIGVGSDHAGVPVAFVGDGRMMRRISEELTAGHKRSTFATVPRWSLLPMVPTGVLA